MENRALLGVAKKKTIHKHRKKRITINIFADYLKADTYFYAPLLPINRSWFRRSKSISSYATGLRAARNCKTLVKKVGDYMKSDCYMYAPIVVEPRPISLFTTPTERGVGKVYVSDGRLSGNAISRELFSEGYSIELISSRRTNMVKHVVYQNDRPTISLSGEI